VAALTPGQAPGRPGDAGHGPKSRSTSLPPGRKVKRFRSSRSWCGPCLACVLTALNALCPVPPDARYAAEPDVRVTGDPACPCTPGSRSSGRMTGPRLVVHLINLKGSGQATDGNLCQPLSLKPAMVQHCCMSRVQTLALVAFITGAVAVGLAIFLHSQHLERAGAWAGIIGLPLAAIGVVLGVVPLLRDRRRSDSSPESATGGNSAEAAPGRQAERTQFNIATGGGGVVFAVQDGDQHLYQPPPSTLPRTCTPPASDRAQGNDS
jgi:hypothetical protein